MNGTISITGNLVQLGELAIKIDDWFPKTFTSEISVPEFEGWNVETMTVLLRRLQKRQLDLIDFVSSARGYRSDSEVRTQFGNDEGGMKGLTGPISRHINALVDSGVLTQPVSFVVRTESSPDNRNAPGGFRMPQGLIAIVRAALDSL